jgi:hypothetical protein
VYDSVDERLALV